MKISVKYFGQLRPAAGVVAETVELPPAASLQDLVHHLADRHGEPFRHWLFSPAGALNKSVLLFVGDRQVRWEMPTVLQDADLVMLLAMMAGG